MEQKFEEIVRAYRALAVQIAELDDKRKRLGAEILQMLSKDVTTCYAADCRVQRCMRLSIKTSLEDARRFGATKHQEVVDKDVIKQLIDAGQVVPDVQMLEFITVSQNRNVYCKAAPFV